MDERRRVWAIGDIHGARDRLTVLLRAATIIDSGNHWQAGACTGISVGDYLNRGENGAGVMTLLRQWQSEAQQVGGELISLAGNHDILMIGVLAERQRAAFGELASRWLLNGGRFLDLETLEHDHATQAWLRDLPAMALVADTLYIHSDSLIYCDLGNSIAEVNANVHTILHSGDLDLIAKLFDQLCRRHELRDPAAVDRLLRTFGGSRVVHGHSPFFGTAPVISPDGRCINIEGGLWEPDEGETLGFVYWAP